jgi:hypothetical protein
MNDRFFDQMRHERDLLRNKELSMADLCLRPSWKLRRLKCIGTPVEDYLGSMGDVADLTAKAYEIVRMIPIGNVTTYGQRTSFSLRSTKINRFRPCSETRRIPELLEVCLFTANSHCRLSIRHVGQAMKMLPSNSDIPWQVSSPLIHLPSRHARADRLEGHFGKRRYLTERRRGSGSR